MIPELGRLVMFWSSMRSRRRAARAKAGDVRLTQQVASRRIPPRAAVRAARARPADAAPSRVEGISTPPSGAEIERSEIVRSVREPLIPAFG